MINKEEELKILLYKFLDSIEYEYNRRYQVACHNYLIHDILEDKNTSLALLELHSAQCQKDCVNQISVDIRKILKYN